MKVYIDFSCPFTNRFHAFLEQVRQERQLNIEWCSFSLSEQNRSGEVPIWEQEDIEQNPAVMTLAGLEELKQRDSQLVDAYVDDAFLLWHSQEKAPSATDVADLHTQHSISLDAKHFKSVQASHLEARNQKVFGSPSLVVAPEVNPLFIKLDHVPEEPVSSWENILAIANDPSIIELKHPS